MLSNRASILAELPRGGAPPSFDGYEAWEAWVERLVRLGVMPDYTRVWWDARPHPRLGTLEVRVADQPTALERTGLIVRLVRDLVAAAPRRPLRRAPTISRTAGLRPAPASTRRCSIRTANRPFPRVSSRENCSAQEPPEPEAHAQLAADNVVADLVARTVG